MVEHAFDALSLRLLRLFETIYRARNISRAADELHTSQPSVSLSLNRLRQHFDDPLFVRSGARMEPTPRAEELIEGVRSILFIASDHFVGRAPFDPSTSERCFTLHMTGPGETILMPRLVERVARLAPKVRLRVRDVDEHSQSMLLDGRVDVILGYLSREAEDLFQCKLHDEHYVCIARAGHPRIRGSLSLEQFRSEAHIITAIAGTGHTQREPGFGRLKIKGRIALEVSSYFAVGATVAQTDLLAVVPARLGAELATQGNIRRYELPLKSPVFQVRQYWHPRFHNDAGNRWVRNLLIDLV